MRISQKVIKGKRCFNVKFSTYYFQMKTKILADFQICIGVPLRVPSVNVTKSAGNCGKFIVFCNVNTLSHIYFHKQRVFQVNKRIFHINKAYLFIILQISVFNGSIFIWWIVTLFYFSKIMLKLIRLSSLINRSHLLRTLFNLFHTNGTFLYPLKIT